jgi:hypothetical protein
MTGPFMSGPHYTPAECTLQQIVESFSNLLFQLEEHYVIQTYCVAYRFCELEKIYYLILWYVITSALPFSEFSEKWLFNDEA